MGNLPPMTPLVWMHRDEVAQIAHVDGVLLSRLCASPSTAAYRAFRTGLDAAIGVAGERAIIVHTARPGSPGMDRSRLLSESKQILRDYDGRIGGACMIVVSSSEFLSALVRSMGAAALLALRLRTRAIFILGDANEAAERLAPIRGVPVATLRGAIDSFELEAQRASERPGP